MSRKPEPGTAVVIRIPTDLHAALKAKAQEEERSMAAVMRRALRAYVEGRCK